MLRPHAPWDLICHAWVVNVIGMLNEPTIEIDDVQRPVRPGGKVHWMKPGIGRSQKLFALFTALRDESRTVRFENAPMHQVAERFAHESVATIVAASGIAAQCIPPINGEP